MLKLPKLTIFAFVACAIALAALIHHFQKPAPGNVKSEMSSMSDGADVSPYVLKDINQKPCAECLSTALAGTESPMFQVEDIANCDPKRRYLEEKFKSLPAVFRNERARNPADFPRVCMTYIMRKNFEGSENRISNALATCKNPNGRPTHGNYPPCVTESYVNATYNYFSDVTSCLGIPQRDFLPKLALESGLHVNSINSKPDGYDGGLAQLTGAAIEHAQKDFPALKSAVASSTNESCKRLAPYVKNLKPVQKDPAYRCQLMTVPANPLLSIVTMAAKIRQDKESINMFMGPKAGPDDQNTRLDIVARLENLGLRAVDYDYEQLMQLMITLGYNSGAKSAVIGLSNYLAMIENSGRKITKADFDIGGESLIYSSVSSQTMELVRQPKNDDEAWEKRLTKFKERMDELPALRTPYKPTYEAVKIRGADGKLYDSYKLVVKPAQLTFPAYMQLYQSNGAAGYVSYVARRADALNEKFKAGTCVPESYLAL